MLEGENRRRNGAQDGPYREITAVLRIGCRSFRDCNRGVMYGNLWMGAVATAGRGEGGWSSPRMTVAGRWLVQGGREEKESLPRAVVLALSGRPTSRPPRSRRIAPVSPPPAFVGPLVPPFSNARIEPPPSSSTLLHFFSPSPFRSVFIFLAFLLIFDFVAEFVDFSSFSIESIAGEFGEILLNFPSPSNAISILRLGFLRFSLLISIVSQVSLLRSKSCLLTFYLGSFSISIQGELAQVANFI